jgi:hypothetical protein
MKKWLCLFAFLSACSSAPAPKPDLSGIKSAPPPSGPAKIALVEKPVAIQDQQEPFQTKLEFSFELPRKPRRARLVLRYSGVVGAQEESYLMGKFRDKVELNNSFLMDLNTYSRGEGDVVEYTKWISPGMFRRHNQLVFLAGDDGATDRRPDHDDFELRYAVLEFDW